MMAALDKHFAGAVWSRPEGGYFIWLELPDGTSATEVLERAEGVTAVLGTDFGGDQHDPPRLQLRLARRDRRGDRAAGERRLGSAIAAPARGADCHAAEAASGRATSRGCRGGSSVRPAARNVGQGRSSASAQRPCRRK